MNLELVTQVAQRRDELAALLVDSVQSGASVGFVPPLPVAHALQYWEGLAHDLQSGSRLLVVAAVGDRIAGAVQLALCTKKNGLHRAEVEKLMVHSGNRRAGLGRALMGRIEQLAREHNRKLLVLDSRRGDAASTLYRNSGFIEAGHIPDYAMNADRGFDATTYFYKQL
jgi:acetyltransferase